MLLSRYFREELQQRIWWGGSVLGRPRRVLLSYTWCLGSGNLGRWGCSWLWGAAGSRSSEGPVSPQGEMGCSGWTEASGLGEGSRLEMSLDSSQGGRGKARWGRWVTADSRMCLWPDWKHLRARKQWPSGTQLHSLFLCKTTVSV